MLSLIAYEPRLNAETQDRINPLSTIRGAHPPLHVA